MEDTAKPVLTKSERIFAWIVSSFAFSMMLLFLGRDWTSTTWGTKAQIVIAGIVCARFSWSIVEDSAKAKICPCCGKRH